MCLSETYCCTEIQLSYYVADLGELVREVFEEEDICLHIAIQFIATAENIAALYNPTMKIEGFKT